MTPESLTEAAWSGYSIRPRRDAPLLEHQDGSLELVAEREYLVELPPGAKEQAWQALDHLQPGLAILRYGNFIGHSSLGGRPLLVTSTRLNPNEVDAMLDAVVTGLHSLPFHFDTPVQQGYNRDVHASEDVDYQAYAFVTHALRGIEPHDLPTAFGRILFKPHVRLVSIAAEVPIARADKVDAETVMGLARATSPLHPIAAGSPLAGSPVAIALKNRVPDTVRAGRMIETTDTPENQFVVAVLEIALGVIDRFRRAVLREYPTRAERFLEEAAQYSIQLSRWRRHLALRDVKPARRVSTLSTVLRGRPGYREVTRFFVDLQARTRLLDPADAQRLLESRDAALIYEYWCFFQVVNAVAAVLGREALPARFSFGNFGSSLAHGFTADFGGGVCVSFNRYFPHPQSYSVPLRPDITLSVPGALHLFDAKLKRDVISSTTSQDELEKEEQHATYRRGDLYKMHTYRDAIGAASVWILFPGRNVGKVHFQPDIDASDDERVGVGALPLLPGNKADRTRLHAEVAKMLGQTSVSDAATSVLETVANDVELGSHLGGGLKPIGTFRRARTDEERS